MCGIFGLALTADHTLPKREVVRLLKRLYLLSESRGKESAGLHIYRPGYQGWTTKDNRPASRFIATATYAATLEKALKAGKGPVAVLAHSRLVTNGTAEDNQNNQPVRYGAVTLVHNGIIVNVDALWQKHPDLIRHAAVDTEIAAALLDKAVATQHPLDATRGLFNEIKGSASLAWLHSGGDFLALATNTGDLFFAADKSRGFLIFASERYILRQALAGYSAPIVWMKPGSIFHISLTDLTLLKPSSSPLPRPLYGAPVLQTEEGVDAEKPVILRRAVDESLLRYNPKRLASLRRCARCILPETFPFIHFDAAGVCNYCHGYRPKYRHLEPEKAKRDFIASLQKYRRGGDEPDAIVAFSGGRDSSYGLHLIKHEFGLTPVTFTYDWGMLTDLARRNIARICGQLGVQNILVSADLRKKRANIRKNVLAWLNKPDLGMVPLFMAGDKHFFKVVNQLKAQTGIALDLWCANPLENTDFKAGFCGVAPDFAKKRVDYLSASRRLKMAAHYARQMLVNPAYINASLADTFTAFLAYYVEPRRDFYFIFDHMVWNEDTINRTLTDTYDWELSPDSPSSWRIGDGTVPFYNYIYTTARGFSEFDTFRSNQIREGILSRQEALDRVLLENHPRVPSLRWYFDTIEVDFDRAIRRVNALDTLGLHRD